MKSSILYIGNNLKQNKSNVSVMNTLGPLLEKDGFKLFCASSKRNKIVRLLDMLWSVFHYSNKIKFVLIDTYSTQNFYYAFFVSQLCRILRLKYIPILHGGDLPKRLHTSTKMCQLLFKNAHSNVSPSKYLKKAFENHGYTNLTYIPNTIEINNYPFINHSYDKPRLLWVRSFSKIYNPTLAVYVLKSLKEKGVDASLCMVGPDSDGTLQEVKDLAKKLEVKVKLTGKLTKQEWIQLSQDYNIFINTTNVDNTPVSVIEAMALGLPIVSTNVGGLPFLIENNIHGILVEKNNVDDMADAVSMIFKNPEKRNDLVLNGRKLAETFDWENVKPLWNEILQK